ncbi:MAG: hypothetical protein IRZ16_05325 [Myxococcaceae bacterium]|nr:hypothetical protein [Myxococcaceae bacterium]
MRVTHSLPHVVAPFRRVLVVATVAASCAGCSRGVDSALVGFVFEPPRGVKLIHEDPGPPPRATFEGGLEIRAVKGTLTGLARGDLPSALEQAMRETGLTLPGTPRSSKGGTIPAGAVGRYEFGDARTGTLLYLVQGDGRYFAVTLTAPKTGFDRRVNALELSMSTLRFR